MSEPHPIPTKRHLLTVLLEDYFHVGAFNRIIQDGQWYRFETRFEQNTLKALDLLDRFNIKATFFVLGWIADRQPEIVREVARRGHEIANRGYYHRSTREMTPVEFREDLKRSREALERASGMKVLGHRAARRWSAPSDLWAMNVLAEEGYAYDSSLVPNFRSPRSEHWQRFAHPLRFGDKELWEFPVSTCSILGWLLPIAGGNYHRQFPHTLVKQAVKHWDQTHDAPFVMYFHVWELDPVQPRISGASQLARIRQYRNLGKMPWILEDYFKTYHFTGIAEYLGLSADGSAAQTTHRDHEAVAYLESGDAGPTPEVSPELPAKKPVTIVVPCFNEELILPYLSNTLKSVEAVLEKEYDLHFIFVDDSSRDGTWRSLQQLFGTKPNCAFLRHTQNQGVAAAVRTGIRHARTEIICSIDCDCTYDPHELRNMIPLLTDGVSMVTASPYHPEGEVRNVPAWRLALSKASSALYRRVLRQKLHTYTSCFRVYRRSAVVDLPSREGGFLGIAEMLGRLDLGGAKIAEYPATLEVRLFGQSKMKVLRTIIGHLGLLARLLAIRVKDHRSHHGATGEEGALPMTPIASGYQTHTTGHKHHI